MVLLLLLASLVIAANAFHLGKLPSLSRQMTGRSCSLRMNAGPVDDWSESVAESDPPAVAVLPPQSQSQSILAAEAETKAFDDNKFYGAVIGGDRSILLLNMVK